MQNEHLSSERRKPSLLKMASYAGAAIGAVALASILALLLFPDPFVNRFIKPRIAEAFGEAYPAYSIHIGDMKYSVVQNRIECDSVALIAVDGAFAGSIGQSSVSAIDWMHLLWGGKLGPEDFGGVVLDAHDIALNFLQSNYGLHCQRLRLSVPDSEIVADVLDLHLLTDDEEFFRGSKFRTTRFSLATAQCSVAGVACLTLLEGAAYHARSVLIRDPFLDVLINKDKRSAKDTSYPVMPTEILASMQALLQVDSLRIMNGRVHYGERFAVGSQPAVISLDNMQVLAERTSSHGDNGAAVVVHAEGMFMKEGAINVRMMIPAGSPNFSFRYSGSLGRMDISALNPFLERAEQMRIVAGVLQSATFDITVTSGRASGNVRAVYRDLTFAAIDSKTGSQNGAADLFASFIANTFKIRGTNVPDNSGEMKLGTVKYTRQRDDPFFRFVWFALRSGVGDVVGF
jgi:hypothetical protein